MASPPVRRRFVLLGLGLGLARAASGQQQPPPPAQPAQPQQPQQQPVELAQLQVVRRDGALALDFAVRVALPKTVEEALQRGVPVYFEAVAELKRTRWYWRDERVARVQRSWRIAYQPLTSTWRVALGGLAQSYPTLSDAMAAATRSAGWRIAEVAQLDADSRYYLEFRYRLDTTQLPSPMQIGLTGPGEWAIGVERTQRVEF